MKYIKALIILVIIIVSGFGFYQFFSAKRHDIGVPNPSPSVLPSLSVSPSPYPDTQSAVRAFLANKYNKPVSEVKITITKEVSGFAAGSVLFGQGGSGEGGMWLAILDNGWNVVWDGNGNVDCNKMRMDYGFPDTILKPNFCD